MKRRRNITIEEEIETLAKAIQRARAFGDFSSLIEQLIREEWERRNGPVTITPDHLSPNSSPTAAESPKHVAEAIVQQTISRVSAASPRRSKRESQ